MKEDSLFGIEHIISKGLDKVQKGCEQAIVKLEEGLERWLSGSENPSQKLQSKYESKKKKQSLKTRAEEQESYLEVLQSIKSRGLSQREQQRFLSLMQMDSEKTKSLNKDDYDLEH